MMVTSSVSDQEQWKANSLGQAADQAAGERQQSADLLPDGEDAGHLGRVPDYQTLPFSGEKHQHGKQWGSLKIQENAEGARAVGVTEFPRSWWLGLQGLLK